MGEDWREGECRDLREMKVKEKSVMTARVRTEPRREQTAADGGCGSFTADITVVASGEPFSSVDLVSEANSG